MSDNNDAVKSLDYYLEHPDEMPTDPESINRLMAEVEDGGLLTDEPAKKEEPKGEEKKDQPAAPASAAPKSDDKTPDGVLTKDGKHFLPYQEMERRITDARRQGEEQARQAAEAAAKEAKEKLEAQLRERDEQLAALKGGKKEDAVTDPIEGISTELLETFRTEYPTQAKLIEPLIAAVKHRDAQIAELRASLQTETETRQRSDAEVAAEEVQSMIDSIPDLASWQKDKPVLFDFAIDQEAKLMSDKKWVAEHPELVKDDAKRYEHVVELVKQAVGLPAASPKNEPDLDRKAEEAVAAAAAATPRSLSDIKGGLAPTQTLEENLENVSADQLAQNLLAMDEEKRARFFARLG